MSRVAVAGAGGWGTALAALAHRHGHEVRLWARREEQAQSMRQQGENRTYLPGVPLPPAVDVSSSPDVLEGAHVLLVAVPTEHLAAAADRVAGHVGGAPVVCCAKGLQSGSGLRPSEVLAASLPVRGAEVMTLSGPNHAEEVGRGLPAAAVLAGSDPDLVAHVADLLRGPTFRIYRSADLIGVELAGALKNVIALACGLADGLALGDNARAALITRGLREISVLGTALGGQAATFFGLAGLGDLIGTASSPHSRNRAAGMRLARGVPLARVLAESPQAVEGVPTTRAALGLARDLGIDSPVVEAVHAVLFGGLDPRDAVRDLMARDVKAEDPIAVGALSRKGRQ